MTRPIEASISLANLRHNFAIARGLAPKAWVMAVVKANAYGHGAVQIARALEESAGGDGAYTLPADAFGLARLAFGVARLEEGLELRAAGIKSKIVLLSGVFNRDELAEARRRQLDMVVHSNSQLDMLLGESGGAQVKVQAKRKTNEPPAVIWLKLDSGMHRLGLQAAEFRQAVQRLRAAKSIKDLVFMSHLACADQPAAALNNHQLAHFQETIDCLDIRPNEALSLANSAALITRKDMHFDWVRPGVMLYSINPLNEEPLNEELLNDGKPLNENPLNEEPLDKSLPDKSADLNALDRVSSTSAMAKLRPVMTLRSKIIAIQTVPAGDTVGYGDVWRARRVSTIGIVAAGYGDGYPRHASNATPVRVNGQLCRLAGRVSMDLMAIDLTDIQGVKIGDPVTLWGEGLPLETVAQHSGTIAYELLTGVNQRVKFRYI